MVREHFLADHSCAAVDPVAAAHDQQYTVLTPMPVSRVPNTPSDLMTGLIYA